MNPKVKALIEKYITEMEAEKFENIVRDAIVDNILDELLDVLYKADITISPEIVTKQLYDFYIMRLIKDSEERLRYKRKINYLINKHQNVIVKTLDAPESK